jgi:hypothetical protein
VYNDLPRVNVMTGYGDARRYTAVYKEYYLDACTSSGRHTMIKGVKNTYGCS